MKLISQLVCRMYLCDPGHIQVTQDVSGMAPQLISSEMDTLRMISEQEGM